MARTDQARELEAVLREALDGLADAVVVTHRGRLMTVAALVPHEHFDVAAERVTTHTGGPVPVVGRSERPGRRIALSTRSNQQNQAVQRQSMS